MNKKGNTLIDNLPAIILSVVCILVGIYIIWAYVLHGGGTRIDTLQQCGSITGAKGSCKELCNANTEIELPDFGCTGPANKCCVPKDGNLQDSMLPAGYGGNEKYNFAIVSASIDSGKLSSSMCVANAPNKVTCKKGIDVDVPITIIVQSKGTENIGIKAKPYVIVNDNPNTLVSAIASPSEFALSVGVQSNADGVVNLPADYSKLPDAYVRIYPYVLCDSDACKNDGGDAGKRGVMKSYSSDDQILLVKYQ